jgi:DNA-binding NarL/FixJ family response regulator
MRRLLIVDGDPLFRLLVRGAADAHGGFEIVGEAETGLEAIGLVGTLLPDVVVMDYAMPVMDGREAAIAIERHWPWIRVVMLTGSVFDRDERAELASHVSLLLSKERLDPSQLSHALD